MNKRKLMAKTTMKLPCLLAKSTAERLVFCLDCKTVPKFLGTFEQKIYFGFLFVVDLSDLVNLLYDQFF